MFFFIQQETAYVIRIVYWSSDVVSSDLSRNCCCMPALVWLAIAADWSAVLRASCTLRLTSAMIGCSLSRNRLNQPASSPNSRSEAPVSGKSVSVRVELGGGRIINKNKYRQ